MIAAGKVIVRVAEEGVMRAAGKIIAREAGEGVVKREEIKESLISQRHIH